jgi:hypothetical protein
MESRSADVVGNPAQYLPAQGPQTFVIDVPKVRNLFVAQLTTESRNLMLRQSQVRGRPLNQSETRNCYGGANLL